MIGIVQWKGMLCSLWIQILLLEFQIINWIQCSLLSPRSVCRWTAEKNEAYHTRLGIKIGFFRPGPRPPVAQQSHQPHYVSVTYEDMQAYNYAHGTDNSTICTFNLGTIIMTDSWKVWIRLCAAYGRSNSISWYLNDLKLKEDFEPHRPSPRATADVIIKVPSRSVASHWYIPSVLFSICEIIMKDQILHFLSFSHGFCVCLMRV